MKGDSSVVRPEHHHSVIAEKPTREYVYAFN